MADFYERKRGLFPLCYDNTDPNGANMSELFNKFGMNVAGCSAEATYIMTRHVFYGKLLPENMYSIDHEIDQSYKDDSGNKEKDMLFIKEFIKKYNRIPVFGSSWKKSNVKCETWTNGFLHKECSNHDIKYEDCMYSTESPFFMTYNPDVDNKELWDTRKLHSTMPDRMNLLAEKELNTILYEMLMRNANDMLTFAYKNELKLLDFQVCTEIMKAITNENLYENWLFAIKLEHPRLEQYCEIYMKHKFMYKGTKENALEIISAVKTFTKDQSGKFDEIYNSAINKKYEE